MTYYLRTCGAVLVAAVLLSLTPPAVSQAPQKAAQKPPKEPDVIFVPTPQEVVDKMLELAKVTKKDVVYDLGCGDGRIVLTAARKYGCKARGFDIDPARIKDAMGNRNREKEEVQKLATFEKKDIFELDLSPASVVTLYLLPSLNVKLIPQLEKLKPGSRIVSHRFKMGDWEPDKTIKVMGEDGDEYELHLWTVKEKKK